MATDVEPRLHDLVRLYAGFWDRCQTELGPRRLVSPDARDFPDAFTKDETSVRLLVERMQLHAGMDDVPIAVELESGKEAESCSSSSCRKLPAPGGTTIFDEGQSWRLLVPERLTSHSTLLTTVIAQALGAVFLAETTPEGAPLDPRPELSQELAAVGLGLGGLLLAGSHVYQKSCGGPSVAHLTAFSTFDLATLTYLMAELSGSDLKPLIAHLEATQRASLNEVLQFFKSNKRLITALDTSPGLIAAGVFEFERPRTLVDRVRALVGRPEPSPSLDLVALQEDLKQRSLPSNGGTAPRRLQPSPSDLKALVSEEFGQ